MAKGKESGATYAGEPADGTFRFTRVWQSKDSHHWQVVAAHSSNVDCQLTEGAAQLKHHQTAPIS